MEDNYIVAFLDILGFKDHVKNFLNPENDDDKEIFNRIQSAFEKAFKSPFIEKFFIPVSKKMDIEMKYKQFSDCTCLSIPDFDEDPGVNAILLCCFLYLLRGYYFNMLEFGLCIRGGLSIGFHYEDDNMIFSDGLIKAYDLESNSVYPRIVIDNKLVERFQEFWETEKETLSLLGVNKLLIFDWEGTVFINPFTLSQAMEKQILGGYVDKPDFIDKSKDLKTNLIEIDKKSQTQVLNNLEDKIKELKRRKYDNNIIRKYIWLEELVKWNIKPENAKIQFDYLLK